MSGTTCRSASMSRSWEWSCATRSATGAMKDTSTCTCGPPETGGRVSRCSTVLCAETSWPMSNSHATCTSLGHEDVPAAGEAYFDEEEPHAWFPFCGDCLRRCDPPLRWYSDLDRVDHLTDRIVAALERHDRELRELHHVPVRA